MSYETRIARIDRFAGLSDRAHPAGLTRVENPRLLNVDFSERKPRKRFGLVRQNDERMKDASIRLDGVNDWLLIRHQTSYDFSGGDGFYIGIGVTLRKRPVSTATLLMKGHTATTSVAGDNIQYRIQYNSAGGTGSLGAWVVTAYDNTAGALRTITLDDGDGGHVPEDQYRFIEAYIIDDAGTIKVAAKLYKEDGTTVTGTPAALTTTIATTEHIVVGVSLSAATSAGGLTTQGTDFINASVCELRFFVGNTTEIQDVLGSGSDYGVERWSRELNPNEIALYLGYWKLNDGDMTGVLTDEGTALNDATIPENPAAWIHSPGETIGQSGIRFFGFNAFAALWDQGTALLNPFITTTVGQVQRWTVRGIFVPKLATGETTVRDQCIFWAGTNATVPGPVGLRIISNAWVATYRDGASTITRTISTAGMTPTALVDKQVRFALCRYGASPGVFRLALTWKNSSGVQVQTFSDLATTVTTPDTSSPFWFIGRHSTSITLPYTFASGAGDLGAFGIIDDFQVVWTNSATAGPVSHGNAQAFQEIASWGNPHVVVAHQKMNEGGGSFILVGSENANTMYGFLYPEENDGAHWDVGLVRPYRCPESGGLFEFNRFLPNGTTKQTKLVNSGCTWYEFDPSDGSLTVIGAAPRAATKWTKDQYAQTAFLASDNGQRPIRYDGTGLENVGIRAPLSAPVLTDAAGGTFTGIYYFYVTYYNKTRNVESNPGPYVTYTYTTRQITQVIIPISPDPQVTTRRLYVSLANGSNGSLAFLLKEFDDNTQITWGAATTPFTLTAIAAPVTSGRVLEFFEREEPPNASIVKVFGDNLFVAGDPIFPTRVYRSSVLEVDYFNQDERNVDFDLDSGDPITGMKPLVDSLFVGLRDGWGRAANTGDTNDPISRVILSRDHGPVGPHAIVPVDRIIYYLSERDIFRTDGLTEDNVSSPPRPDFPSIQNTMKTGINPSRRASIVGCQYKGRKQLLFSYSSTNATRNDRVLCYDMSQGVFSDYELGLDFITELEDENDDPTLYGVSEGYVVKLDQEGVGDGLATPRRLDVLTFTAGTCPFITYSGDDIENANGLIAFCYKRATDEVLVARCEASVANNIRFYSVSLGLSAGDIVIVGGIRFQMDWLLDFGESIMRKRLRALYLSGKSNDGNTFMRLQWVPHEAGRTPSFAIADQSIKPWATGEDMLRFEMGGLFRTIRVRLSESDDALGIYSADPWVSTVTSSPVIYELAAKAEVMNVE